MLVLKRRSGQWTEVVHAKTGDILRIRVCEMTDGQVGCVNLAFDDGPKNFLIEREERKARGRPVAAA